MPLDLCEKIGNTLLWHFLPNALRFLPNAPQLGECTTFSRQKAPQFLICSALQFSALQGGHQSAVYIVEEEQCTCVMFSSATAACLLHSLTRNVIIESVDSISRDERDVPLTQYITKA